MRLVVCVLLLFSLPASAFAQDTLLLTRAQADSLFLKNNLRLLAERFQVEASLGQLLQAGLRDNPTVSLELSAFNSQRRQVLDVGRQGQKIVAIQQLLYTAGKHHKRLALATEASRLSEYELLDLVRALRFDLRSRFYAVYFQQQTIARFSQQIAVIQTTVNAYEQEYARNNVSLRELLRLKALLFQLSNERTEILFQLADDQRALRVLLSVEQPIQPIVRNDALTRYRISDLSADTLRQIALRNRPDLKAAESLTRQAQLTYTLQRSLATPDLRVGGTYDQAGSYIQNYVGLNAQIDVPILNRNQGAIRAARSQIKYQTYLQQQQAMQIGNDVVTALQKVREVERMVQSVEGRFTEQFELLNQGIITSFQKGNISLLEFVDFVETYNESVRQLNRLKADRVGAYEELNYVIGDDLFD